MANLSTSQLQALKQDITVDSASVVFDGDTLLNHWTNGANGTLANYYNAFPAVDFILWRPDILPSELMNGVDWSEFVLALEPNRDAWFALTSGDVVDATIASIRSGFATIFGGGSNTIGSLTAIAQVNATNGQKLFSTAEGGANVSAIFGQEISLQNIRDARDV